MENKTNMSEYEAFNYELDLYYFRNNVLITYLNKLTTFYKLKKKFSDKVSKKLIDNLLNDFDYALNMQKSNSDSMKKIVKRLNESVYYYNHPKLNEVYDLALELLKTLTVSLGDNEKFAEESRLRYKMAKKQIAFSGVTDEQDLLNNDEKIKQKQLIIENKIKI